MYLHSLLYCLNLHYVFCSLRLHSLLHSLDLHSSVRFTLTSYILHELSCQVPRACGVTCSVSFSVSLRDLIPVILSSLVSVLFMVSRGHPLFLFLDVSHLMADFIILLLFFPYHVTCISPPSFLDDC